MIKNIGGCGLEPSNYHYVNSNPVNHYCRKRVKGSVITIEGKWEKFLVNWIARFVKLNVGTQRIMITDVKIILELN